MGTAMAVQAMLAGMPMPADLSRAHVDGRVVVRAGAALLFDYAASDTGMRKLAVVTLPELGFTGRRVAKVLGITEEYVSMLRARARRPWATDEAGGSPFRRVSWPPPRWRGRPASPTGRSVVAWRPMPPPWPGTSARRGGDPRAQRS